MAFSRLLVLAAWIVSCFGLAMPSQTLAWLVCGLLTAGVIVSRLTEDYGL